MPSLRRSPLYLGEGSAHTSEEGGGILCEERVVCIRTEHKLLVGERDSDKSLEGFFLPERSAANDLRT